MRIFKTRTKNKVVAPDEWGYFVCLRFANGKREEFEDTFKTKLEADSARIIMIEKLREAWLSGTRVMVDENTAVDGSAVQYFIVNPVETCRTGTLFR